MKISVVFVGKLHDRGFNASALIGIEAARNNTNAEIEIIHGIPFEQDVILKNLTEAGQTSDGVVVIGGQGNIAAPKAAAANPGKKFAVVQGAVTADNLASYDVLQEESAFLAGCLAGLTTQSGTVGHLSGHRVRPGLKGRAAYVAGVNYIEPEVKILTAFCGTQDDSDLAEHWAAAELEAGADILFTMLNEARSGAIAACRKLEKHQIGNALDWTKSEPDVFIGSAVARIDIGAQRAIEDMVEGIMPTEIVEIGLADKGAVFLAFRDDVPETTRSEIAKVETAIRNGAISIPAEYDGLEFNLEEAS